MTLREQITADVAAVFLNEEEFAEAMYFKPLDGDVRDITGVVDEQGTYPELANGKDNLEFLRLEENVEVYLNKETGEEVYTGRTSTPVDALFQTAVSIIEKKYISAGQKAVSGKYGSAITIFEDSFYQWKNGKPTYYQKGRLPNGVELPKTIFETTGLYVNKTKSIFKLKRRFNVKKCYLKKVTRIETVDLNNYDDFSFAESINFDDYNC